MNCPLCRNIIVENNKFLTVTKSEANIFEIKKRVVDILHYQSKFYFYKNEISGIITLPEDTEIVNPGDDTKITVELELGVAIEKRMGFSIRKGERVVETGTITKVIE